MAKPSYPEKLLIIPAPLVRLREEELRAMIVVWGAICEAVRRGEEPVFRVGDLAALIVEITGWSRRTAYRMLARLAEADLDGQPLLIRESWTLVRAGEALAPWIEEFAKSGKSEGEGFANSGKPEEEFAKSGKSEGSVCQIWHFAKSGNPDNKEVPHIYGGGGYMHGLTHDTTTTLPNLAKSQNWQIPPSPALRAMARAIGIVREAGFAAVEASGLGPRALWRLWVRIREGGGGVGALVTNLVEAGEGARDLAPAPGEGAPPPLDPCPRCGAGAGEGACPACGAELWECPRCRELATGSACPWCGAEMEWAAPDAGFLEAWNRALETLRGQLPPAAGVALEDVRVAAVAVRDGEIAVRVRAGPLSMRILQGASAGRIMIEAFGKPVRIS